jgi:ferrochelatase
MERIGVILLNLGGPEREEEIPTFLRSMLSDPHVVDLPWPARPVLARLISAARSKKVAERYRMIGGGSPIGEQTQKQVEALADQLGEAFVVRHVFRHAPPRAERALSELVAEGISRVVALPAYPQRSRSTTGSAVDDLRRATRLHRLEVIETSSFPDGAGYIESLIAGTLPLLEYSTNVIISAHGLTQRMIDQGDPYVDEVGRTADALAARLPSGTTCSLAFQSRLGPVEWTRPYLTDEIKRLAGEGVGSLVVVPISFAAECLETTYELSIEVAELAHQSGIASYRVAPAPGTHPAFIDELARLVRDATKGAAWEVTHAS